MMTLLRSKNKNIALVLVGFAAGIALLAVRRQPDFDPWADWGDAY